MSKPDIDKPDLPLTSKISRVRRPIIVASIVLLVAVSIFSWIVNSKIPPNTSIDTIPVGWLSTSQALALIQKQTASLEAAEVALTLDDDTIASTSTQQLRVQHSPSALLVRRYENRSFIDKSIEFIKGFFQNEQLITPYTADELALRQFIAEAAMLTDVPATPAAVHLNTTGVASSIEVEPGTIGQVLDQKETFIKATDALRQQSLVLPAVAIKTGGTLSEAQQAELRGQAELLVGRRLNASAERVSLSLTDQQLVSLLAPEEAAREEQLNNILTTWNDTVSSPAQEPVFEYDPETLQVRTFTPPRPGRELQEEETKQAILDSVRQWLAVDPETGKHQAEDGLLLDPPKTIDINLALVESEPNNPLSSLNNLGISERIGFGESQYAHSIPNRIHNVAITSQRINNVIIPPGAEFSFNKTVGDISAATGYRSAYVIRNGRTELGDGGGVCQVSTTLFRTVLNAGLKITKRLPHSYRVSYYELDNKPGLDATVYAGDVDFRFINDTPGHILIHSVTDDKNTYMYTEMYGTSDGRSTEIVEHKTWDFRGPPAPQYFPDPTLPPGKLVQIDYAASGIRASVTNVVKDKDGNEIRRDTFTSNYRPWSAKYLQGVDPNQPQPTP